MEYLNYTEIAERYKVNVWTIRNWVKLGKFPKPLELSEHCHRWKLETIEKWEKTKEAK